MRQWDKAVRRLVGICGRGCARVLLYVLDNVGWQECITVAASAVLAVGLWAWSRPVALITLGVIGLWVGLPTRPPFVERSLVESKRK
jgi:hypothetical protein